jgi:uncharacterized protein
VRLAVLADTHLPRGRLRLPARCLELLDSADAILHAGDLSTREFLTELEAIGPPVHAVHGNVDEPELRARLPERLMIELHGVPIGMVHDGGRRVGRLQRLRSWFPAAEAVVFGHSHLPLLEERDGFQIFNPGSATLRRRAPARSMGLAEVHSGRVTFRHLALD